MWDLNILEQMLDKGYHLEDGNLVKECGSISNYVKVKIYKPYMMYSLIEDKEILGCFVEYEEFSEPGYLEMDHLTKRQFNVPMSRLVEQSVKWAR